MNENIIINSLKYEFIQTFSILEEIIKYYPYNILKKDKNALIYLQELIYQFDLIYVFLNENKDVNKMGNIDGKNIFPEFEPNKILTKDEIMKCFHKIVIIINNWFSKNDDEWLKSPYTYNKEPFKNIPLIDCSLESTFLKNLYDEVFEKYNTWDTNFDQTLYTMNSLKIIIGKLSTILKKKSIRDKI